MKTINNLNEVIEAARTCIMNSYVGQEFILNDKEYFVDIDSDDTLFITHEINGEWEVIVENIIIIGG